MLIENARDDCIEKDDLVGFVLLDSLLDGCHVGVSASKRCESLPCINNDVTVMDGALIRLAERPYRNKRGDTVLLATVFYKTSASPGASWPKLAVRNSVWATDNLNSGKHAWKRMYESIAATGECEGNVFLYLKDDLKPEDIPAAYRPPSCFRILTGEPARAYWEERRNQWMASHGFSSKQ